MVEYPPVPVAFFLGPAAVPTEHFTCGGCIPALPAHSAWVVQVLATVHCACMDCYTGTRLDSPAWILQLQKRTCSPPMQGISLVSLVLPGLACVRNPCTIPNISHHVTVRHRTYPVLHTHILPTTSVVVWLPLWTAVCLDTYRFCPHVLMQSPLRGPLPRTAGLPFGLDAALLEPSCLFLPYTHTHAPRWTPPLLHL